MLLIRIPDCDFGLFLLHFRFFEKVRVIYMYFSDGGEAKCIFLEVWKEAPLF